MAILERVKRTWMKKNFEKRCQSLQQVLQS